MRVPPLALLAALALAAPLGAEPLMEDPAGILGVAPTGPEEVALTLTGTFERARDGRARNGRGGEAELEIGLAPGLDLRLSQAALRGQAGPRGDEARWPAWEGASRIGLRWQLAEQDGWRPDLGLAGGFGTEYGLGRPSEVLQATALAGWRLRDGPAPTALTLNLGWETRLDPEPGERPGRYQGAIGLGQSVAPDTMLGLAWVREQQERGERDLNLVLGSVRHRPAEGVILGAFAGGGVGRDSPSWVAGVSLKLVFGGE